MVTVRCFGGATAIDEAGAEITLRSRKHTGLFLYLAAHARTTHSREELADLLWEGTGRRERHSLSQALYDIRSHAGRVMEVTTKTVRLLPERVRYEMVAFEEAVGAGDHDAALELYRGEFAPNLLNLGVEAFDRWLDAERERSRVLAAIALRNAQRAAEERGDWDQMALAALRLIRQNEFDEEAHCALMRGLWMKGDPASALAHYRSLSDDGTATSMSAARALADRISTTGVAREVLVHSPRPLGLRGRDDAFRKLMRAWSSPSEFAEGLLVVGRPGTGKTALLTEFARAVGVTGARVDWLVSDEDPSAIPDGSDTARRLLVVDSNRLSRPALARIAQTRRFSGALVCATSDVPLLGCETTDSGSRNLVRLEPLDDPDLAVALQNRMPDIPAPVLQRVLLLSGGIPGLALGLAEAARIRNGRYLACQAPVDQWVAQAQERSAGLRFLASRLLDQTQEQARRVLSMFALVSSDSRQRLAEVLVGSSLREGYLQLTTARVLIPGASGPTLSPAFLESAERGRLDDDERRSVRSALATALMQGDPAHRLAAAKEIAASGDRETALRLAERVVREAKSAGHRDVVASAAAFATDLTVTSPDRARLALEHAQAEVARGRFRYGENVLRELADRVNDWSSRRAVLLALARAQAHQGSLVSVEATLREFQRGAIGDPEAEQLLAAVEVETARLLLGRRVADESRIGAAAESLEVALVASMALAAERPWTWLEGVQTLFREKIQRSSRSDAEKCLDRFGPTLVTLGDPAPIALGLWRACCDVRRGSPRAALRATESLLRDRRGAVDQIWSAAANNAAVMRLETGDTAGAWALLQDCREVDSSLEAGPEADVTTLLNETQCAFFSGDLHLAMSRSTQLLDRASEAEMPGAVVRGNALRGLVALSLGDADLEEAASAEIAGLGPRPSAGDDTYFVSWFRAARLVKADGREAAELLLGECERLLPVDELSAWKLAILAGTLCSPGREGLLLVEEGRRRLRGSGVAWFERFARAWSAGGRGTA